ncbi:MAG: RsmD family RNA methyltransferase [Phycisphaerales bacterium]
MRIIAGEFKSRPIYSPPDEGTRPMPDRVKESVFSILRGHCEGARVADFFSGTGTVGLEAISRGAVECVFVEKRREVARILEANIEMLGAGERAQVVVGDALGIGAISRVTPGTHLIFMDPPYAMMEDPAQRRRVLSAASKLVERLDPKGYLLLRTPSPLLDTAPSGEKSEVSLRIEGARGPETHDYRGTAVHFYVREDAPGDESGGE